MHFKHKNNNPLLSGLSWLALVLVFPLAVHAADTTPSVAGPTIKPVATPTAAKGKGNKLIFNFQNADIQAVIKTVAQITGKNFLLDPRVKGKVTIISTSPVSKTSAYQIFLSALKAQGFTAVSGTGGIVKIIPVGEGKQNAGTTSKKKSPSGGDLMVTHVVAVEHGQASQLVPLLRPLMAPTSTVSAYAPANSLIITDYAQNIRRLLKIVAEVDQPVSSEVTVITLKHASALDISELVAKVESGGRAAGAKTQAAIGLTIVPDLRTNSLLVRSSNPGRLKQLNSLIEKLDVPAIHGGDTHVVYLRNTDAVKLAEVLRGLIKAEAQAGGKKKGQGAPASLIQADESTNSLIISASDAVYNNLRAVIEKLDIRRAQVYVEALIAEVTTDKASELGFQWAALFGGNSNPGIGFTNYPAMGSSSLGAVAGGAALGDPSGYASSGGLNIALLGPEINIAGQMVRSIAGLAKALEQKTNANILSTPNLLTMDNNEAKIVVGQNVPFVTGSYAGTSATTAGTNPFQTIERKDVGLTLKIKPQISEGGMVKLEIFQEVSSVITSASGAADLITNKRSLETTVIVDDGNTIALGGLIEDKIEDVTQQVTGLGNIPILGALFRYKRKAKVKTNLMIFLKPNILYNPMDAYRISADRYDYLMTRSRKGGRDRVKVLEAMKPVMPKPKKKEADKKKKSKNNNVSNPLGSEEL